jgi:hydroxymethylpyrimidine pyrophosphatase-like HAD family hydrolase
MNRTIPSSSTAPQWLLVCDIDDTFIGDDSATRELIDRAMRTPSLGIALNSSRPLKSVEHTLLRLPCGWRPMATITAMGTEIALDGRVDERWTRRFGAWDRRPVDELARRRGWAMHPDEFQTPLKASFTLPPGADWQAVRRDLAELEMETKSVISGAGELDVLPPSAGKGSATLGLAQLIGIDPDHIVVAGDSANDLDMFQAVARGIVVGNAREELRSALRNSPAHFFATRSHAAGIIEGLLHLGILSGFQGSSEAKFSVHTGRG